MSAVTVFPVGHYGGTVVDGQYAGNASERFERGDGVGEEHLVRVGHRLERLSDDEFGVWMLAHGLAEVGKKSWTREDILDRAGDAEITDPAARLSDLLDRKLFAAVPTSPDRVEEAVAFARAYRLETLLVGLGMAPDRPDRHAIGVPGVGTAALLDDGSYRLWRWGAVAPTLWRHCQDRGRLNGATQDGATTGAVDPALVLRDVLGELRVLLVHGCAYLDAVGEQVSR